MKTKIEYLDLGLNTIDKVNCYKYKKDDKEQIGVIAQELMNNKDLSNLVKKGRDGFLSVNYIQLIPILINSVKELKKEVEYLKKLN